MESNINWQARYNELQDAYMKERAGLQAKVERYENALKDIASGKALPQLIAQQALSAGEGKKENLPEPGQWNDYLRDNKFNQKEDKQ